jgi:hypothetical protein
VGIVTGKDLFGQSTWGEAWEDGYKPLETLDSDKNGVLSGSELQDVYVWMDANINAMVEADEIRLAGNVLKELSVRPLRERGNAWAPSGAVLMDGKTIGSWDWYSSRALNSVDYRRQPIPLVIPTQGVNPDCDSVEPPYLYIWMQPGTNISGYLRFFQVYDDWFVATFGPDFPYTQVAAIGGVVIDGDQVTWRLRASNAIEANMTILSDGQLEGTISSGDQVSALVAYPLLPPYTLNVATSFISLPDEAFAQAVLSSSSVTQVQIPPGIFQPCFGKSRTFFKAIIGTDPLPLAPMDSELNPTVPVPDASES